MAGSLPAAASDRQPVDAGCPAQIPGVPRRLPCPPAAGSSPAAQYRYDACMAKGPHLPPDDEILTAPAAAQIVGLDRAHFRRLIREGKGPVHQTVRAGKRDMVLILRRDLDVWIKARDA